jgi:hypothetical protein
MRLVLIAGILLFVATCFGQDLSTLKDRKPFEYNGSFSINQNSSYRSVGTYSPYSLYVSGNASASIYGISFPFSFSYSNQQVNYSQPFNFNHFGAQPSYKWVKTYVGYNSMSFSQYSLNGHQFLGGGLELSPPETGVKFSLMYGRLVKGVEWDTLHPATTPYFERFGYAGKIEYGGDIGNIGLSVFKAWDKKNSLRSLPDSLGVTPKENMVYTINFGKTIIKKIKIAAEFAGSALTLDTRQFDNNAVTSKGIFVLIKPNGTTSYNNALKGSLDYLGSSYTIGVSYERVDPGYSTLGSYYSNNDLENIAITFSKQLNDGKLNVSGSLGKQRNNLDKSKMSTSENFLGSLNISYAPGTRISLNASYSNYSYYTFIQSQFDRLNSAQPYQNIDTLNFSQVTQSAMLNTTYLLGNLESKEKRHVLTFNFSYQEAVNRQESFGVLNSTKFYQSGLVYAYSITPKNLSITGTLLTTYNVISATENMLMTGPVLGVNKAFFNKKMPTNLSVAYNTTFQNGKNTGDVFSLRIGGGYTYQKVHRLSFGFNFIHKNSRTDVTSGSQFDVTGNINYLYTIGKKNKKE